MNHTTKQKPQGNEEERLALAFGRANSPAEDVSSSWLGGYYLSEQYHDMEVVARQRGLTVVAYVAGYDGHGRDSEQSFAKRYGSP